VRVKDHDRGAGRNGTGFDVQRTAVDQQAWSFDAGGGTDLVHIAALAADEIVFRALGDQRHVDRRQVLEARQGGEQPAHGHRQRGRRGQARALRHVAGDRHVHAAHRQAARSSSRTTPRT
jgi:hypothetical protein